MAIDGTIPDSQTVGVQQIQAQDPTNGSTPGVVVPPAVLQMLMKTSAALAPKPSAAPPHPQITALTSAIAGGLQFSFTQLTSPTPYKNVIDSYRIYRNRSGNTFSGSQLIKTIPHDNSVNQKTVQVQDLLGSNQSASYFCTAVDSTGQESTQPGAFQSATVSSANFNPNITQAVGSTSAPFTNSGTFAVIPEMTVTITTKGGKVLILFAGSFFFNVVGTGAIALFRDGVQVSQSMFFSYNSTSIDFSVPINFLDAPSAGSHTYDVRWNVSPGTVTSQGTQRQLQVVELG